MTLEQQKGEKDYMGFFDDPKVDLYSKASEESVLATKQFFLQRNGFLARDETPDKGVDLDVELMIDDKVSGFKFAIQIKSVQDLQRTEKGGKSFIVYNIKTSRLGYLCRRHPGFGLIVIYDDKSQALYYDYVENIYARIRDNHKDDEWMKNDNVTFQIESTSILSNENIVEIYDKMKKRHSNTTSMYSRNSYDYDLPTFKHEEFENPLIVLEKYGYLFFNSRDYQILYHYLSEMPSGKILTNPKLLLLAAITYYRIGLSVEGDYYLKKCESFLNDYSDEEKELLQISKLSSHFILGELSGVDYYEELKKLLKSVKGEMNSIHIQLQLVFNELLNVTLLDKVNYDEIFKKLERLESAISKISLSEEVRYCYMMELVSFVHQIGIQHFLKFSTKMIIQKKVLGEMPFEERLATGQLLVSLIVKPQVFLNTVWEYAKKVNNEYLQALVFFKKNYMFHSYIFQSLAVSLQSENGIEKFRGNVTSDLFKQAFREVICAYNIFYKKMDLTAAYRALTILLEINYLHSFLFSNNIDTEIYNSVIGILPGLEKELRLEPYKIITEDMILSLLAKKNGTILEGVESLSPEERIQYAEFIAETMGLPADRLPNMVAEMDFMAKAKETINLKYFEILQNLRHCEAKETMYKDPPRHIIQCRKCNYKTVESEHFEVVLACLRTEHLHLCL